MHSSAAIGVSSAFIGAFTAFFLTTSIAAEISARDDLGNEVSLEQPARRIVTLAPFLTELVYSAGAGERLVGVSAFSDYPPQAKALPQVASAAGPALERIAALQPDLVLAWKDSIRADEARRIASLGTAVFVAQARTLEDIPRVLRAVGRLTGRDVEGAAREFEQRVATLRARNAAKPELPVFLEIWHRPLTTVSGRHFINQALAVCRGRNVFADFASVAPVVPWEALYARDPPAIIGVESAPSAQAFEAQWREHPTLAAVKQGRLAFVGDERLERPSLRLAGATERLCATLDGLRR